MPSKLDFGLPAMDYSRLAADAVHEVRSIIAAEPTSLRGIFWTVMWEAARVSHKQLLLSFIGASQLYEPTLRDALLVPKLALATYFRGDLLVALSHTAEVRPFRPAKKESAADAD